jgi:TorA maturation chaperone TorD
MSDQARQWLRSEGLEEAEIAKMSDDQIGWLWNAHQQMQEMTPDELRQSLENHWARVSGVRMSAEEILDAVEEEFHRERDHDG